MTPVTGQEISAYLRNSGKRNRWILRASLFRNTIIALNSEGDPHRCRDCALGHWLASGKGGIPGQSLEPEKGVIPRSMR